jgi:S-adenosylmethionine decarboxylase
MQLSIIVATIEGCRFDQLDDVHFIEHLLVEAVSAGGLTMLHKHVHKFEPQGVTAAAVLSESHLAVHTWPENGLLFIDIATCSTAEATQAAFERVCALVPHTSINRRVWSLRPKVGDDTEQRIVAFAQTPLDHMLG